MALNNPPDGWKMASGGGTWGTDVDESTSTLLSGVRSINFLGTSSNAPLEIVQTQEKYQPVLEGRSYRFWTVLQADSVTAGDEAVIRVSWYQEDGTTEVSKSTIYSDVLDGTGAWELKEAILEAPANARLAQLRARRNAASWNLYVDDIGMVPAVPQWQASMSSDQTVSAANDLIDFDTSDKAVDTDLTDDGTNGYAVDIEVPGIYTMVGHIEADGLSTGEYAEINFVRDTGLGPSTLRLGQRVYASAGSQTASMNGAATVELSVGDRIYIGIATDASGNLTIDSTTLRAHFAGFRVE